MHKFQPHGTPPDTISESPNVNVGSVHSYVHSDRLNPQAREKPPGLTLLKQDCTGELQSSPLNMDSLVNARKLQQ